MTDIFQIPLSPRAQTFAISLAGTTYNLTWRWCSAADCWMLSIADVNKARLVSNIPIVTGRDLLEQHKHLGIAGSLIVQTDNDPDAVPTYRNLGVDGRVFFYTGPKIAGLTSYFILNQSRLG